MQRRVLVTGGNFENQGAFLMLAAAGLGIRRHLGAQPVLMLRCGNARQKAWLGYDTLLGEERIGFLPPIGGIRDRGVRGRLARRAPVIGAGDIDAVVDICGFAFGDEWSHAPLLRRARNYEKWFARGVPVYMLPQSFGPFELTAGASRRALGATRIIFPRDPESASHAEELFRGQSRPRMSLRPDFTLSVKGVVAPGFEHLVGAVAIVPNRNIMERSDFRNGRRYLDGLTYVIRKARSAGLVVYGLCHEGRKDSDLLAHLGDECGGLEVVDSLNGIEAKGLLGRASAIVAGRYHAAVSGLCQGVPVLIQGWTHKYSWLAADFHCPDLLVDPFGGGEETMSVLLNAINDPLIRGRLKSAASEMDGSSHQMWQDISHDFESEMGACPIPLSTMGRSG